jgi:hypothetical protein
MLAVCPHLFSDGKSQKKFEMKKCTKERVLHSSHHLHLFDINAVTPKESKARPVEGDCPPE